MIKHFNWSLEGYGRGRVAISIDEQTNILTLAQIAGNAPPAALAAWGNLINAFELGEGEESALQLAAQLHAERVNRFAVERRVGMSGAVDYRLIVEKNAALADYPTVAVLHISMADKLNGGIKMWLGDFYPIYQQWLADNAYGDGLSGYTAEEGEALVIEEAPTRSRLVFRDAEAEHRAERSAALAALYELSEAA